MSRPKVLQLGVIQQSRSKKRWAELGETIDIIVPKATNRDDFITECNSGAFQDISVAFRTLDSITITGRLDSELVSCLPSSLKFICHNAAGYDQIDIQACTDRGIKVSNVKTAVDDATADTAMFLMLGALRNFNVPIANLRAGLWYGKVLPPVGRDPRGKILGILGMGGIGRNMARKALAFGMKIQYHNRTRLSAELEGECRATYVDKETLFRTSDQHTRHSVSTDAFKIMKRGIIIINTARGPIIDEEALVRALEDGQVANVGLDVFENEPEIHPGLLSNPKAMLMPHVGTWTIETETQMEEWTIENVRMAVQEQSLKSIVPEQANAS